MYKESFWTCIRRESPSLKTVKKNGKTYTNLRFKNSENGAITIEERMQGKCIGRNADCTGLRRRFL